MRSERLTGNGVDKMRGGLRCEGMNTLRRGGWALVWPLRSIAAALIKDGSPGLIRTGDHSINSRTLYR